MSRESIRQGSEGATSAAHEQLSRHWPCIVKRLLSMPLPFSTSFTVDMAELLCRTNSSSHIPREQMELVPNAAHVPHNSTSGLQGNFRGRGSLWITMEYCAGGSVSDLIRANEGALEEPLISHICMETLKGLAYLHGIGKVILTQTAVNGRLNAAQCCKHHEMWQLVCALAPELAEIANDTGHPDALECHHPSSIHFLQTACMCSRQVFPGLYISQDCHLLGRHFKKSFCCVSSQRYKAVQCSGAYVLSYLVFRCTGISNAATSC